MAGILTTQEPDPTVAPLVSSPPTTARSFGRYLLQERVATGGMAEVFRALYRPAPGVEKTVALKRVLPHLARDPDFLSLFRQEAALSARLAHANVVQLLDVGEVEGEPFLALEFVHGRNLRQILRRCADRKTVMPIGLALYVAMEAAKGLAYAHALKDAKGQPLRIVHRDVSPANVLVSFEGEVKIADFGIARAMAYASTTAVGTVRGKASYLSPEQAQGDPLDGRSDQFALGAVLWELITGRRLFAGDTETEILGRVVGGTIPSVSKSAPGVPHAVDEVVMKALTRAPSGRHPDALAFSRALAGVLAKLGPPVAGADVAAWMRSLFAEELAAEDLLGEEGDPTNRSQQVAPEAAPVPAATSAYADDLESEVQPLPLEERRKLFDLPPARASAAAVPRADGAPAPRPIVPVDEPLELVRDERVARIEKQVTRLRVGGVVDKAMGVLRLGIVGVATAILLFGFMLFVHRR